MALTSPFMIRAGSRANTPLDSTMKEIRVWLDRERIEPAMFKTVVRSGGLGFEISFKSEHDAARFQRQFPQLIGID